MDLLAQSPGAMAQQQAMQAQMQLAHQMSMLQAMQNGQEARRRADQKRQLQARGLLDPDSAAPMPKPSKVVWRGPKCALEYFPLVLGDTLVVVNRKKDHLLGLDLASGKPRWDYPLPLGLEVLPLQVGERVLLVNKAFEAVLLDPATGIAGKRFSLMGDGLSRPAGYGQPEVLFPAVSGDVLLLSIRGLKQPDAPAVLAAFDVVAGRRLWFAPLPETPSLDPLVCESMVVTGGGGKVRAYQIADGKAAWTRDLGKGAGPFGSATLEPHRLAFACRGRLVALDAATGDLAWDHPFGGDPLLMPEDGRLFYLESRGTFVPRGWLVALDPGTGSKVWEAEAKRFQLPWFQEGKVVLLDEDDQVRAYAADSGKALWSLPSTRDPLQMPLQGSAGRVFTVKYVRDKADIESLDLDTGKPAWSLILDEDASSDGMILFHGKEMLFPSSHGIYLSLQ